MNLRDKLYVGNFNNAIFEIIYKCQRTKRVDLDMYCKYRDFFDHLNEFDIAINNVGCLNLEQLEELRKDNRIKGIYVKCGYSDDYVYSMSEYENILMEINEIISNISMPDVNNPDREKNIFAQLYMILGKRIVYDHYALTEEGKNNEKYSVECRNLKNGLLGIYKNGEKVYTCVCAGYATILQNICSVLGINCNYIRSYSKEVDEYNVVRFGKNRIFENGTNDPMGHAYNNVELDGQSYFCDLTWDSSSIRVNDTASNFLKSYDDFYDNHRCVGFSSDNVEVIDLEGNRELFLDKNRYCVSVSLEEQINLFSIKIQNTIEEMKSIGYLGGFVSEYVSFVKDCKNKIEVQDLYQILGVVYALEQYILSDEFKERGIARGKDTVLAIPIVVKNNNEEKSKSIVFYDAYENTVDEAIEKVEKMVKYGR